MQPYMLGIDSERVVLAGETAIFASFPSLADIVVRRFFIAPPEGGFEVLRRPRRGDRIKGGEFARIAVRALQDSRLKAIVLAEPFAHGEAHCFACGRTFYARSRHDIDHECDEAPVTSWEEALTLAEKMDAEDAARRGDRGDG